MTTDKATQEGLPRSRRATLSRARIISLTSIVALLIAVLLAAFWLGNRVTTAKNELQSASQILPLLKSQIADDDSAAVEQSVQDLMTHTAAAREATSDPLWTAAGAIPWLGANFQAAREIAISADDVARLGAAPLASVFQSVDWRKLVPGNESMNLKPLSDAEPHLASAAHAIRSSADRLKGIDANGLVEEISGPLLGVREQLASVESGLDAASSAASLAPGMLGSDGARTYLLLIQNNAETRATGGIPGAIAVLTADNGKLTLGEQTTAAGMGSFTPPISVETEQQQIYSGRLGKYMQDVNLTPDFPTSASAAQAMWERKTGRHVDGVISVDPVALGYILNATGPVSVSSPELVALATGMPTELNGKNVVSTLLSDVYAKIDQPKLQDAYFASVAHETFAALSSGKADAKGLIEGVTRGTAEGRVLVWSGLADEQAVISKYRLSGSIAGPSVSPAQFGVYFNDGTGAKMDYYVKRTVELVEECTADEYGQVKVRITSTNTAPANAATSLPAYVTGNGIFGVPPGTVRTNVIAYGPVQANVETVAVDGQQTGFAAHRHSDRPVGSVTITLAPGQSSTVEITFGKIVQHTEPNLVVTPTVQSVKDVVLGTKRAECVPEK